ncbi:MAG TPA: helix-turn-helix domain-containing protein, partial [Candidatus Limnocylindrales bacterium]
QSARHCRSASTGFREVYRVISPRVNPSAFAGLLQRLSDGRSRLRAVIDDAGGHVPVSPKNVTELESRPLPWWATMPPGFFDPPAPDPVELTVPVTRSRQRVRRKPGPGRPSVMTDEMIKEATTMYASGEYTAAEIAEELGVSRSTIFRHLE